MKKSLVLTGMMGVGKSTIGKLLSEEIKVEFEDIDMKIESMLSMSINDIFKNKGEKFFREIEEKETIKLLKSKKNILALGGGAFLNKNIRENVKIFAVSIWLDLDPEHIFKRIKNISKRPLLNNTNGEESLKKLYDERKDSYSLADYKIDCNFKTKNEIIEELKKIYENI